ncbi:MAG: sulfatase-like hydrolase/transferase [Paludibacter sp.]|nr:sulfatase-like hydrolase/transferase [Paludibacter sp.]MDD4198611.1 sulfatase-like hydrolase/transferase [Paludibacter sp.]MDD4428207.1 sulfatase-like hydrolase/transferase [Paludibacter sp.]
MKISLKTTGIPAIAMFASCTGTSEKQPEQPNIIIIMADDLGYGDLSWLGATTIETPNVNRLADEGVRFVNCYSTSATSTPSRYGMLTGMYPWRKEGTGIAAGDAPMLILPEQYTMADMFKSAGYSTGAVGKWHLGLGGERGKQDWNGLVTPNLTDIGFDYSYIMAATGDRVPCVYIENGKVVNLDPNDPIEVSYTAPFKGEPTALNHPELLTLHPSQGHDQSIIRGIPRIGYMKGGKSALWKDEEIADNITRKASEFIVRHHNQPFFLYFGTHDIHVPRVPHPRFKGLSGMGDRGDAILSFDYCVGRILDIVDSLGIADNTIILLTSDNGPVVDDGYHDKAKELLGNHKPAADLRAGKYSIFEAGTKVPCIIRWPQGMNKPGSINPGLMSQIDFFASFASFANAAIPENAAPDSRKLDKLMKNKTKKGAPFIIQQNLNSTLSIVKDEWKYIEPSQAEPIEFWTKTELGNNPNPQLYNLSKDPGEINNLSAIQPEKRTELKELLEKAKK